MPERQQTEVRLGSNHVSRADDWPTLLGRMFDDLTRIIQMEMRLFEANLSNAATGFLDRALSQLVLVATVFAGGACLLAAFIDLLHRWFEWWQAFAIGGVTVLVAGVIVYRILEKTARKTETQVTAG